MEGLHTSDQGGAHAPLNFNWLADLDQKQLTLQHIVDTWTYSLGMHTGLTGTPDLATIMLDRTTPFLGKNALTVPAVYFQ